MTPEHQLSFLLLLPPLLLARNTGIAAGVADPDVDAVVLLNDVVLRDSDWDGHVTPIPLLRNVTISGNGTEESPDSWPLLDANFVSDKARAAARKCRRRTHLFYCILPVSVSGLWNHAGSKLNDLRSN